MWLREKYFRLSKLHFVLLSFLLNTVNTFSLSGIAVFNVKNKNWRILVFNTCIHF